jgi:hypothetical protein
MLALACDFRLMNADKGFICTNELALGEDLLLHDGLASLAKNKSCVQPFGVFSLDGEVLE